MTLVLGLSPEQIAERRQGIGGSDAADIMAGNWLDLWKVKTGRTEEPDLYDKLSPTLDYHVLKHYTRERLELTRLMGHATEDLNCFWFEKTTGRAVQCRRERAVSKRYPWMVANLDGMTTTSHGLACYWDAKHLGRLDEPAILRLTPQGVHCATILGVDWWVLSVFIGNSKHEIVEQEVDPLYQATLIEKEREFWSYVERDEEPPDMLPKVLAPKPQPKLRELLVPTDAGDVYQAMARENNWLPEAVKLIRTIADTEGAAKKHAITREELKTLVPEDVGELRFGAFRLARSKSGAVTMSLKVEKSDEPGR